MAGSSPDNVTSTTKTEIPEYMKPIGEEYAQRTLELFDKPYESYDGERVAPLTDQQYYGMQMIQDRAMYGDPYMDAARSAGMNLASGGASYNPYIAGGASTAKNKYIGQYDPENISVGQNALLGMDNPYLAQAIQYAQDDVSNQFRDVTNPMLQARQRQAGAFGNTGAQAQERLAMDDYAENLGQISNAMRMQDYALQAQLGEADLNRLMAADQFNSNLGFNTWTTNLGAEGQLNQFNAGQKNQMTQARMAAQNQANALKQQGMLQAMQMAPVWQDMDYRDAQMMLGVGDALQGYNQQFYDNAYEDWWMQNEYPYRQFDVLSQGLNVGSGGGGTSTTTQPNPNQVNPAMLYGGLAAGAYGLLGG